MLTTFWESAARERMANIEYVPQLSRVVLHGRHDMIAVDEQLRHMHETQAHLTETDHNPEYNPRNICDAQSAAG